MGMAWPKASMGKIQTVFKDICDAGKVDDCSFAFYLTHADSKSELHLGGFDSTHADGDMKYYPLAG